jgi:hypothetical protein
MQTFGSESMRGSSGMLSPGEFLGPSRLYFTAVKFLVG